MYPWEYKIFNARSCSHNAESPVSSTVLMGGGEKDAVVGVAVAGLPRGLDITPPNQGCSIKFF
jgi:hypothetical protein